MDTPEPESPRRSQFSLRTLLLVVVIVALLSGLVAMRLQMAAVRAEMSQIRAELGKYRRDYGYLEIGSADKMHATGIRDTGHLSWQWRVYLPEGNRYALCIATHGIPGEGVSPHASRSIGPRPGESPFSAYIERRLDGKLWVSVGAPGGGSGVCLGESVPSWLSSCTTDTIDTEQTVSVEAGKPLVLLRLREMSETHGSNGSSLLSTPDKPCNGLMIWIEETR